MFSPHLKYIFTLGVDFVNIITFVLFSLMCSPQLQQYYFKLFNFDCSPNFVVDSNTKSSAYNKQETLSRSVMNGESVSPIF
jgi:hypothetical protein